MSVVPSKAMQAVVPSSRMEDIMVVVCQWPCGVWAWTRSPLERPPAEPGQVGFGPRFVQKDQPGRVKARLLLAPEPTRPGDVRAVLLTGAECLFLYVSPILPSTTLMACKEQLSPVGRPQFLQGQVGLLASRVRNWLLVGGRQSSACVRRTMPWGDVAGAPTLLQGAS